MSALHKFLLLYMLAHLGHNAIGSRIIHGEKVPENSMLYMASVQSAGSHICGGFLISEDFVMTAAHCDTENPSVVLGTHDLSNVPENMRYDVKKCKHPSYETAAKGNDIMLLKLSRKAPLGSRVKTVELPSPQMKLQENTKCHVAGWGATSSHGVAVHGLLETDVSIIDQNKCQKLWNFLLPASVTCAGGYDTNKGFCQGDSGGPLVCNGKAVGIVSFNFSLNCRYPNVPNVYTDISKYLPWINKVLGEKTC